MPKDRLMKLLLIVFIVAGVVTLALKYFAP